MPAVGYNATLYISQQGHENLIRTLPDGGRGMLVRSAESPRRLMVMSLAGINVQVVQSLPIRTGKIIQRDRFATYDAADMWYAEPLGLAKWDEQHLWWGPET